LKPAHSAPQKESPAATELPGAMGLAEMLLTYWPAWALPETVSELEESSA